AKSRSYRPPGETLTWCDVQTGKVICRFGKYPSGVDAMALSADGRYAVATSHDRVTPGEDNRIQVWDTTTGKLVRHLSGHEEHVMSLAFLPDSRRVVSGSCDGTLRVWDVLTGRLLRTCGAVNKGAEQRVVCAVGILPSGRYVLAGHSNDDLKIWE